MCGIVLRIKEMHARLKEANDERAYIDAYWEIRYPHSPP